MKGKRKLKPWTTEELEIITEFFTKIRTRAQKDSLCKRLERTWGAIYNKHWAIANPEKSKEMNTRAKQLAKTIDKAKELYKGNVKVVHINQPTTIKIGECIIETFSKNIKVNNVLIEM
jgi:hypothetical protein